ncbi:rhodanese-like domain-containing protein [Filobacillus milosensis]|uniref:Rhodanese-like domain-containing protein n=1 Tax=Filobacillus milosensis TaxID=94137 RepID=A0A4Y8IP47_9BACI|nr:rhodanese-like domain-containing protein [Filobacillus milosensis]TFB21407.1 rhodanese-like domain-containing protein [Filobacillus milosensis]
MSDSIEEISPEEVEELIKQGKAESIIDVREHNEVMGGRIPNARHIPLGEIIQRTYEIEKEKEHVIVCRSGNRSGLASEWLQERGFKIKNMTGGMSKWKGDLEA